MEPCLPAPSAPQLNSEGAAGQGGGAWACVPTEESLCMATGTTGQPWGVSQGANLLQQLLWL